ncbi:MAG: hypothetical protein WBV23_15190 [Desulfobaccales bacterium]
MKQEKKRGKGGLKVCVLILYKGEAIPEMKDLAVHSDPEATMIYFHNDPKQKQFS